MDLHGATQYSPQVHTKHVASPADVSSPVGLASPADVIPAPFSLRGLIIHGAWIHFRQSSKRSSVV